MTTVVFFISGHGFGHASREIEIIRALAAARPGWRLVVRTAVSPSLLTRTLDVPHELRPGECDAGIVQSSSIAHDDAATIRTAIEFYRDFDDHVDRETRSLARDGVSLIVGDIPPLAFEVARTLSVPSIAVFNFTWDWIFETHPGLTEAAPWLVSRLSRAYQKATLALQLPFAGGFDVFPNVRRIPLVARRPTHARDDTRSRFSIPADRPALLLSFGGYGLPDLDLSTLDVLGDWTVVTTDRSSRPGAVPSGVLFINEREFTTGYRYEDLVAAVDAVVTKPGYGIVAECIAAGVPMLYTSRGEFREYDLFVREMPRFLRCEFIDHAHLFGGHWAESLKRLMALPAPPETMRTDGAAVAAAAIIEAADASRSAQTRPESS